ncbi:MAG: methyltransferase domain-containing protein [Candidatus Aenigmatarchaeota archaeon]
MKIAKGQLVLLVGPEREYLAPAEGKFNCKSGTMDMESVIGREFGKKVRIGEDDYYVLQPRFLDLLYKKAVRGPQVISPKDAAVIAAETGCGKGSRVVDAGSGSCFLALMLANMGCDVTSYEKEKKFFDIAKRNAELIGSGVKVLHKDITKGISEKNLDLVTLDMEDADKAVKNAFTALKPGGWLAVFSLHAEHLIAVRAELEKHPFTSVTTVESLRREWQFQSGERTWTRPKTHMLGHTGFITFARKL